MTEAILDNRLYVLMRSGHVSGAIKTNDGWLIDKDLAYVLKQLLEERLTD